ncbi:hypothetical protein [Nonomuraea glycinis]|uniref:hypothetical protein n=1 Tax=Nonomuraea glycinis TaxID=2047744 RepID=UPI002E150FB0|nr:hypothetical protein OHA68_25755 [Nonomuraea glycinis]
MAFLSRLFRRSDPLAEREEARRQGMRDARRHPLNEFTDPDRQPAYVTEVRARAREQITEVDRELAVRRTALLERALGAQQTIMRELSRHDLRPSSPTNGHLRPAAEPAAHLPHHGSDSAAETQARLPHHGSDSAAETQAAHAGGEDDPFISIAEARWRRAEARRRRELTAAGETVRQARARLAQLGQEWESALIEREHAVEALHARAEQLIAAYRSGVLRAHPRREEIPSLWKGEVIAMNAAGDTPAGVSGREEMGRILHEVEERIEVWHAEVLPTVRSGPRLSLAPQRLSATPVPAIEQDVPEESEKGGERDQGAAKDHSGSGSPPKDHDGGGKGDGRA